MLIEHGSEGENQSFFDQLARQKPQIEERIGAALVWDRVTGRRRQRVATGTREGGYEDEGRWTDI